MVLKKHGMQKYCLFPLTLLYTSFSYRFAITVTKWNRTSFFLLECCFQIPTPIPLNHCHRLNKFQRPLGARFGNTSADEPLSENWNFCFKNTFNTSWLTGGLKLQPPSLFSRFSPKREELERERKVVAMIRIQINKTYRKHWYASAQIRE